jgi:hypothetical protein
MAARASTSASASASASHIAASHRLSCRGGSGRAVLSHCAVGSGWGSRQKSRHRGRNRGRRGVTIDAKIWTDDCRRKAAGMMGLTVEVRRARPHPAPRLATPRPRLFNLLSRSFSHRPEPCFILGWLGLGAVSPNPPDVTDPADPPESVAHHTGSHRASLTRPLCAVNSGPLDFNRPKYRGSSRHPRDPTCILHTPSLSPPRPPSSRQTHRRLLRRRF